jgi:hypothetical protein
MMSSIVIVVGGALGRAREELRPRLFLKARRGAGAGASADRLIAKLVGRRYPTCMSEPARRLLDQAMQLPTRDRAALAVELLASLEGEQDLDAETAWAVEIERRVRRVESGEARFEDWPHVRDGEG